MEKQPKSPTLVQPPSCCADPTWLTRNDWGDAASSNSAVEVLHIEMTRRHICRDWDISSSKSPKTTLFGICIQAPQDSSSCSEHVSSSSSVFNVLICVKHEVSINCHLTNTVMIHHLLNIEILKTFAWHISCDFILGSGLTQDSLPHCM